MNESGIGYLRVRVTAADLPVSGAAVRIAEYPENGSDGETLYSMTTDSDGLTEKVALFAPSSDESQTPGYVQPYAVYNIFVDYSGYYPVEGVGVPIFDRVTAIQPVKLVPLTEEDRIAGGENGRVMIYEIPDSESLKSGGVTREDIGNNNGTVSGGVRNATGGANEQ